MTKKEEIEAAYKELYAQWDKETEDRLQKEINDFNDSVIDDYYFF